MADSFFQGCGIVTHWLRLRIWLGRNLPPLVGAVFGLALAFLFLSPLLLDLAQSLDLLAPNLQNRWFVLLERIHALSIQALICAWVFALGSSIASFLNVVAYRLPRGRSILGRSICPRCCQQISLWDNVPIFGWLRNGGRCRICHLPIASRYFWVEFLLGFFFLIVFLVDVGTARTIQALQFSRPDIASGAVGSLGLFFGHALLLSLIFVVALIQLESFRLPKSLLVAGWTLSAIWFVLFHVGYPLWRAEQMRSAISEPQPADFAFSWFATGASVVAALILGAIIPLGWHEKTRGGSQSLDVGETCAYGWIGLFLSWPLTLEASVITATLILIMRFFRARIGVPFACAFLAVVAIIAADHWLELFRNDVLGRWRFVYAAGATALTIGLSLIARRFEQPIASCDSCLESTAELPQTAGSNSEAHGIGEDHQPNLRAE